MGAELKNTFCLLKRRPGLRVAAHRRPGMCERLPGLPRHAAAVRRPVRSPAASPSRSTGTPTTCRQSSAATPQTVRASTVDGSAAPPRACRRLPGRQRLAARRRAGARRRARRPRLRRRAARCGAANSCCADYRGFERLAHLQAGRDARRRTGRARTLAQHLCAADGRDGLAGIRDATTPARAAPLSGRQAARGARRDAGAADQLPAGQFVRAAVRRGRCGDRRLPRARALRRPGRDRARGAGSTARTTSPADDGWPIRSRSRGCRRSGCRRSNRCRCGSALLGDLLPAPRRA